MPPKLPGIHHITALASDPQQNIDFYTGFLGLRLVKKTVNFDAPDVYHFYYGDETGTPGTLLTFFPFSFAERGKMGSGETAAVAFSIPPASLDYWMERLAGRALHFEGPIERFGDQVLAFEDPDGMVIELITDPRVRTNPVWSGITVDPSHALRSFHGVTFAELNLERSAEFLTKTLAFRSTGREGERNRFVIGEGNNSASIDILYRTDSPAGRQSAGSVHHIAWRTGSDDEQLELRKMLVASGTYTTEVLDRVYFHSIYFREPGGVLFEIATDGPGMLIDEPVSELGVHLKLPPWLDGTREKIGRKLIPVTLSHNSKK